MLLDTSLPVGFSVTILLGLASVTIIGRNQLGQFTQNYDERFKSGIPAIVLLGGLLVFNQLFRDVGTELSWLIGWNITGAIYKIEGEFVGLLQEFIPEFATPVFTSLYLVGYIFLIVFPIFAYLVLKDSRYLRETAFAYSINHILGLVLYSTIIAYGPRNMLPDIVEPLMYTSWPESQIITSAVNTNTNVFPSLHTSMSVTVAILAYRTRNIYTRWFPVATAIAVGVVVSTMYLGIHWGIDVLAGSLLAVFAVWFGTHVENRWFSEATDEKQEIDEAKSARTESLH
ncbi:MAG: phosphatase PAP2 family protein [Halobacteriota archaeon]